MTALLNIAFKAARQAGSHIMRHFDRRDTLDIKEKNPNDFVSEIDVQAEHMIIEMIHQAYPDHGILAEESGEINPGAETTWIIDPLDGTTNYLHGLPHFAVSIAVKQNNRIEHGVVYDPIRQEFFTASRGQGARLNSRRIRVTQQYQLSGALLGTGFPFKNKELADHYFDTFKTIFSASTGIRRAGSAALDLAYVAAGRLDGYWEFSLRPWDIAAGALLIKEAGGLVGDFEGGESYLESGNIVVGTPKVFRALLQHIKPNYS